jgi:hypothetical protein
VVDQCPEGVVEVLGRREVADAVVLLGPDLRLLLGSGMVMRRAVSSAVVKLAGPESRIISKAFMIDDE